MNITSENKELGAGLRKKLFPYLISQRPCRFFAIVGLILGMNQSTHGQGPGAAWTLTRPVNLSPVTPTANFQVRIILVAGQYTGMKADGSDLRFYDNGNNNCEYWIEQWNNTGTSTIWVKVPTSGANALTMYYGNAAAGAVSNGATTFDFFDDLN